MMPDWHGKIQQIHALQIRLMTLARDLGQAMAVPASQRDGEGIRAKWAAFVPLRPQAEALIRDLRGMTALAMYEHPPKERLHFAGWLADRDAFAQQVALWELVAEHVACAADTRPTPLLPPRAVGTTPDLNDWIAQGFHALANPVSRRHPSHDRGRYADIALPMAVFARLMQAAGRIARAVGAGPDLRFLDVGCGGGSKVFAAAHGFAQCDGLEVDDRYLVSARATLSLLLPERSQVIAGDALTFTGYHGYDVIYFYRPLKDNEELAKLEAQVFDCARPGTVVVAPCDRHGGYRPYMQGARVVGPIYLTGVDQPEADRIRQEAERTCLPPLFVPGGDPGFWGPILAARVQDSATIRTAGQRGRSSSR